MVATDALTQVYSTNYCLTAAAVLAVYEHVITFDREVLAIWQYHMTGATILLLSNRYVLLFTAIYNVLAIVGGKSDQVCEASVVLYDVVYIALIVISAVFSTLRVYAIAGRKWYWASLVLFTGLVLAVTNTYLFASESHPYRKPLLGIPQCTQNVPFSDKILDMLTALILYFAVLITTRTSAIVSDLVVVVATWLYAFPWAKHASDARVKAPLMLVILRDGTGYFIILSMLNAALMAIQQLSYSSPGKLYPVYITVLIPVISGILISRFIFNLRQHADGESSTTYNDSSSATGGTGSRGSIEFGSRLVGNMGASLDHSVTDSLLFNDGDEPQEDIGCNEELAGKEIHDVQSHQRDEEAGSDAGNVGIATTF